MEANSPMGAEAVSEPITDAEELGAIAYDAGFIGSFKGWDNIDDDARSAWRECAAAIKFAVCPPEHVVVAKALVEAARRWYFVRESAPGDWMDADSPDYWEALHDADIDLVERIAALGEQS